MMNIEKIKRKPRNMLKENTASQIRWLKKLKYAMDVFENEYHGSVIGICMDERWEKYWSATRYMLTLATIMRFSGFKYNYNHFTYTQKEKEDFHNEIINIDIHKYKQNPFSSLPSIQYYHDKLRGYESKYDFHYAS